MVGPIAIASRVATPRRRRPASAGASACGCRRRTAGAVAGQRRVDDPPHELADGLVEEPVSHDRAPSAAVASSVTSTLTQPARRAASAIGARPAPAARPTARSLARSSARGSPTVRSSSAGRAIRPSRDRNRPRTSPTAPAAASARELRVAQVARRHVDAVGARTPRPKTAVPAARRGRERLADRRIVLEGVAKLGRPDDRRGGHQPDRGAGRRPEALHDLVRARRLRGAGGGAVELDDLGGRRPAGAKVCRELEHRAAPRDADRAGRPDGGELLRGGTGDALAGEELVVRGGARRGHVDARPRRAARTVGSARPRAPRDGPPGERSRSGRPTRAGRGRAAARP